MRTGNGQRTRLIRFCRLFFRDYLRRILRYGLSPANACSVVHPKPQSIRLPSNIILCEQMTSPSQNFPLFAR